MKLFFMHIAKTAGTSINKYIESHYAPHEIIVHLESYTGWTDSETYQDVSEKKFLSGHVQIKIFENRLNSADYFKFTVLRNPIDHVRSHLSFVKSLNEEKWKPTYEKLDGNIQKISRKLGEIDFSKPKELEQFSCNLTDYEKALFDNTQTRYLLCLHHGDAIKKTHINEAASKLYDFNLVGITENLDATMRILSQKMGWEHIQKQNMSRKNTGHSYYGFDKENFQTIEAVEPLIRYDVVLYDQAETILKRHSSLPG